MLPHLASTNSDAERVVEILRDAFATDPVWSFVFSEADRRPAQYEIFMRLSVDGAMRHDTVWLSPGGEAAAVWLPPGSEELLPEDAARFPEIAVRLLGSAASRLTRTVELFEQARPTEAHYYLSLLGTDPTHRGHGIGIELLKANLQVIDAAGLPAYLESTNPINLDRYRHLGFREFGSFTLPDDGPEVTKMWWEPTVG